MSLSSPVTFQSSAIIPTDYGDFLMMTFADSDQEFMPHVVLAHPDYEKVEIPTVRVHSECITGDLFGSKRCDCGEQLQSALSIISKEKGLLLYLRQEGRGIGIINKLKAYRLQDEGLNTIDANVHLGFEPDERDFSVAIDILKSLDVLYIKLLTNNPEKVKAFDNTPITVVEHILHQASIYPENKDYLQTKKDEMGHFLDL